jgi:hypothetical protein
MTAKLGGWLISSWRWLKRRRAAGWPIADGRIESTEVTKPNFSFTTKRGYCVAQMGYSYSVAGTLHSGLGHCPIGALRVAGRRNSIYTQ